MEVGAAVTQAHLWAPGYKFYVSGSYDSYGRIDVDGFNKSIQFSESADDTENVLPTFHFERAGVHIWAKALEG